MIGGRNRKRSRARPKPGPADNEAETLITMKRGPADDRSMRLSSTLAWLIDSAAETPGADLFLAELGKRLIADGAPLAGGALTLAVPHPLIARRTWLWRAENGEVIEALGFVPGGLPAAGAASPPGEAGRRWLAGVAAGVVHEDAVAPGQDGPSLGWIGPRPFTAEEAERLRQTA